MFRIKTQIRLKTVTFLNSFNSFQKKTLDKNILTLITFLKTILLIVRYRKIKKKLYFVVAASIFLNKYNTGID